MNSQPSRMIVKSSFLVTMVSFLLFFMVGPSAGQEEVRIGMIVDQTSSFAGFDQAIFQGVQMFQRWHNDNRSLEGQGLILNGTRHEVVLVTCDASNGDTATAVRSCVQNFANQSVDVIIGSYSSSRTSPASDEANNLGIPYISTAGLASSLFSRGFPYFFCPSPASNLLNRKAIDWFVERGATRFSVVYKSGDLFSVGIANDAMAYLQTKGVELVLNISYAAGTTDEGFTKILALMPEITAVDAEVVIYGGQSVDLQVIGTVFSSSRYGPNAAYFGGQVDDFPNNSTFDAADQWTAARLFDKSLEFGVSQRYLGTTAEWFAYYEELFGVVNLSVFPGFGSAACVLWQIAAEGAGPNFRNASEIREALYRIPPTGIDTFWGPMFVNAQGYNSLKQNEVVQLYSDRSLIIRNSSATLLYPAEWAWLADGDGDGDGDTALIVGLTVGLGGFFLLVIIVAAVTAVLVAIFKFKFHVIILKKGGMDAD